MVRLQFLQKDSFKIKLREIFLIFLIFFLIEFYGTKIFYTFSILEKTFILRILDLFVICLFFLFAKKTSFFKLNYLLHGLKYGIIISACTGILFFIIYFILLFFFSLNILLFFSSDNLFKGKDLIFLILTGVIAGPLAEEFFFRGILYNYIRQNQKIIFSIITSSAIFALFHFKGGNIPAVQFAGGIFFACSYEFTKNIFVPCIIHITGNLFIFSIPYLLKTGFF
jgi:hypothetical protein